MLARTGITPPLIKQIIPKDLGEILASRAAPPEREGFQQKLPDGHQSYTYPRSAITISHGIQHSLFPVLLPLQKDPNPPNQSSKIGVSEDGPAKPSKTLYPSQFCLPGLAADGFWVSQTGFPNQRDVAVSYRNITHSCFYPPIRPMISLPVYIFVPQGVFLL